MTHPLQQGKKPEPVQPNPPKKKPRGMDGMKPYWLQASYEKPEDVAFEMSVKCPVCGQDDIHRISKADAKDATSFGLKELSLAKKMYECACEKPKGKPDGKGKQ